MITLGLGLFTKYCMLRETTPNSVQRPKSAGDQIQDVDHVRVVLLSIWNHIPSPQGNFIFPLAFFWIFLGHNRRCLELLPESVLRNYSWQCGGDHMGCQRYSLGRLHGKQMPYLLSYCFSPEGNIFKNSPN